MDSFLWWSGIALWAILAIHGFSELADKIIDWIINGIWTKREFLAFVWDRLKRAKGVETTP